MSRFFRISLFTLQTLHAVSYGAQLLRTLLRARSRDFGAWRPGLEPQYVPLGHGHQWDSRGLLHHRLYCLPLCACRDAVPLYFCPAFCQAIRLCGCRELGFERQSCMLCARRQQLQHHLLLTAVSTP